MSNGMAKASWEVASATPGSQYILERSLDYDTWKVIAEEAYDEAKFNFEVVDYTAQKGWNLYRLRMVDANGETTYSEVERVNIEAKEDKIAVLADPFGEKITLVSTVEIHAPVKVFNSSGTLVETYSMEELALDIDLSTYASGIYFARINQEVIKFFRI